MDYITYELHKLNDQMEKADIMADLGIETEEEFKTYIEDQKDFYNECRYERLD